MMMNRWIPKALCHNFNSKGFTWQSENYHSWRWIQENSVLGIWNLTNMVKTLKLKNDKKGWKWQMLNSGYSHEMIIPPLSNIHMERIWNLKLKCLIHKAKSGMYSLIQWHKWGFGRVIKARLNSKFLRGFHQFREVFWNMFEGLVVRFGDWFGNWLKTDTCLGMK